MRRWLAGGLTTVQPKASMRKHQPVGLSLGGSYIKATEITRLLTKMVSGHTHVPEMEAMCCLSHFPAPTTALQGVTWPKMELAIFHHILPKAEEAPSEPAARAPRATNSSGSTNQPKSGFLPFLWCFCVSHVSEQKQGCVERARPSGQRVTQPQISAAGAFVRGPS